MSLLRTSMTGGGLRPKQLGFTYVIVMLLVAVLSVVTTRALEYASTSERREKETDLLWAGMAFRNAIEAYHKSSTGNINGYPTELEQLLYVDYLSNPIRPLRKIYRDPITGAREWGLVKDGDNIIGVYSLSPQRPIKQAGFDPKLAGFVNAQHYSDWKFVYQPEK
ncbi:type II secretion system protein [Duganella sp. Root1480D1]|uniref:type II secretion system protein n=1 Tax=Duganella sp. Root1480D1 TaxID=1736471 RepID=UPI0012E345D5|nr:type II secretion system protein [Duganella sp. Root1480D1]